MKTSESAGSKNSSSSGKLKTNVYPLESFVPSSDPRTLFTSSRISDINNKMKSSSVSPGPFPDSKTASTNKSSSSTTQNTKSDFVSDKGGYRRRKVTTRRFTMESRVGDNKKSSSFYASNKTNNQISASASATMSVKNYEPNDSPALINVLEKDKRVKIGPKGVLSRLVAETAIGDKGFQGKKYQQNITALKGISNVSAYKKS